MNKDLYVYNEQTLSFEKVKNPRKVRLIKMGSLIATAAIAITTSYLIFNGHIQSPTEKFLDAELSQMERHYSSLTDQVDILAEDLAGIHQKDGEVHRMIFGMAPIDSSMWEGGIGGHEKHKYITKYTNTDEIIEESIDKVDKLKRQLSLQKQSLDTLLIKAIERETKLASIPSIKPVQEDKLKRKIKHLSGYGFRIHPIHKVKKFHHGIDFTCPTGTAIQATGDGYIKKVEKRRSGFGKNVVIDHGFGFETLYAHMNDIDVKVGQKVKKGEKIGTVGSTGLSTAPHLHYEVRVKGKSVNPIDYCLDGLSSEEYRELVEKSAVENQSFD